MLRLKNINRTSEYIEADYFPENLNVSGHIKVDLKTERIIDERLSAAENSKSYLLMAKAGLLRHKSDKPLLSEYTVMWY